MVRRSRRALDGHREDRIGVFGARPFGLGLQRNKGKILARTLSLENIDNSYGTVKTTGKMSVSGYAFNDFGRIDVGSASIAGPLIQRQWCDPFRRES